VDNQIGSARIFAIGIANSRSCDFAAPGLVRPTLGYNNLKSLETTPKGGNKQVKFYPLVLDDANRNLSKRPGQSNDCVVRALSIVTETPYDTVYELLAKAGREPCEGFDCGGWLRNHPRVLGGKFTPVKVAGLDDRYSMRPDLTPLNFACHHPSGRYILENEKHVWAVINGVHHDLWRVKNVPLSAAWLFAPNSKRKPLYGRRN